jgi:multiple sugar transport system permease protein
VGYASAMGWVLFIIILVCTLLVFRFVGRRVYYGGA